MENLFAEKLTELLEENSLSKRECARQTNISAQSISDWSTGKISPTAENIFILAKFFNVSTDYLLGLENERSYGKNKEINSKKYDILATSDPGLTEKEKRLLKAFMQLSDVAQNKLIEDAEFYANHAGSSTHSATKKA